jgi:hypothetical protein
MLIRRPLGQPLLKDSGADDPWTAFPIATEIASDPQSEVCLDFARVCLLSCLNTHQNCSKSKASAFPRRLTHIRPAGKTIDIRLVDTSQASEPYVALREVVSRSKTTGLGSLLRSINNGTHCPRATNTQYPLRESSMFCMCGSTAFVLSRTANMTGRLSRRRWEIYTVMHIYNSCDFFWRSEDLISFPQH